MKLNRITVWFRPSWYRWLFFESPINHRCDVCGKHIWLWQRVKVSFKGVEHKGQKGLAPESVHEGCHRFKSRLKKAHAKTSATNVELRDTRRELSDAKAKAAHLERRNKEFIKAAQDRSEAATTSYETAERLRADVKRLQSELDEAYRAMDDRKAE